MLRQLFYLPLVCVLALIACGEKPKKQDYSRCSFAYDTPATKLQWTAYKFTERAGVSGTFKTFEVKNTNDATKDPVVVFQNASISIDTASVDSNNPDRDKKIATQFFGKLKDNGVITGQIAAVEGNKAKLRLKLNGIEREIEGEISRNGDLQLALSGKIDLGEFRALSAVDALNKVCYDLHKGKDGKSKLWPDVQIKIETTVKAICPG